MELTDENLDYQDCRPLNPNTGIKGSAETEKRLSDLAAVRSAKRKPIPEAAE